jgi:hypothetical protein
MLSCSQSAAGLECASHCKSLVQCLRGQHSLGELLRVRDSTLRASCYLADRVGSSDIPLLQAVEMLFRRLVLSLPVSYLVLRGACLPAAEKSATCIHGWHHKYVCRNDPSGQHTGISEALLREFYLMSQYAAAAYCPGNLNSPGTQVTCPVGNCPLVEAANATTILEFTNIRLSDDSGFVAVDDKNRLIVASFRGTLSRANWMVDLRITKAETGWCDGCSVHKGFWGAWQEIKDKIMPLIERARSEHPDYRVVLTGHSLGAAIATLAATDIRRLGPHYLNVTELVSYSLKHHTPGY